MYTMYPRHIFGPGGPIASLSNTPQTVLDSDQFRNWANNLKPGEKVYYISHPQFGFVLRKATQDFVESHPDMFENAVEYNQQTRNSILQWIDDAVSRGLATIRLSDDGQSAMTVASGNGSDGMEISHPNGGSWPMYGYNSEGQWSDGGGWDQVGYGDALRIYLDQIYNGFDFLNEEQMSRSRDLTERALRSLRLIDTIGSERKNDQGNPVLDGQGRSVQSTYHIMAGDGALGPDGKPTTQLYFVGYEPGVNNEETKVIFKPINETGTYANRGIYANTGISWKNGQFDHGTWSGGDPDPEVGGEKFLIDKFGTATPSWAPRLIFSPTFSSKGAAVAQDDFVPIGYETVLEDGFQRAIGPNKSFYYADSQGRHVKPEIATKKKPIYPHNNAYGGLQRNLYSRGGQMTTRVPKYLRDEYGRKLVRVPGWGDDDTDVYF